ncbi:hypothetical protein LINPERHAP1_LOCUS16260 [Linum perenne]
MYPIAWSVVEVESKASWDGFLEQLQLYLDIGDGFGWCFSSDQQKVNTLTETRLKIISTVASFLLVSSLPL